MLQNYNLRIRTHNRQLTLFLDIWPIATFLLTCDTQTYTSQTVYFQLSTNNNLHENFSMFYVQFVKIAVCQFYIKWISINQSINKTRPRPLEPLELAWVSKQVKYLSAVCSIDKKTIQ